MPTVRIDVHQHIWSQGLIDALARRTELPFARLQQGAAIVHLRGEPAFVVDTGAEHESGRAALLDHDGVDVALACLSSPLGIEALPRAQAQPLIDAYLASALSLGPRFGVWGALALDDASAADVDELLDRGCVGLCLPAGGLATIDAVEQLGEVLARLQERDAPLFVHPGAGQSYGECNLHEPLWWPALTRYVAQMQSAWLALGVQGRSAHPRLRVIYALLAGGGPLLEERLRARGGPAIDLRDHNSFYEVSSHGPHACRAIAQLVGAGQLVWGTDRPVVEPARAEPLEDALDRDTLALNSATALGREAVARLRPDAVLVAS